MVFSAVDDVSSVDYIACCGLGHRLARMAAAYTVARSVNFTLRSHWGWCGGGDEHGIVEVYSTLFDAEQWTSTESTTNNKLATKHRIRFLNDVPGFRSLVRTGGTNTTNTTTATCPCDHPVNQKGIRDSHEFYTRLRQRFRHRDAVEQFVAHHDFAHRTVIGLHVRGGNGETGDFARKQRAIPQSIPPEQWVERVLQHIHRLDQQYNKNKNSSNNTTSNALPLLLYVATDTPALLELIRQAAQPRGISVIEWTQERAAQGVFFGTTTTSNHRDIISQRACLARWRDAVTDLMLLSRADVVIAGRPSSFVQTLPMALALGRPSLSDDDSIDAKQQQQQSSKPWPVSYCEVVGDQAQDMVCFSSYREWCCEHATWVAAGKEFVQFAVPDDESLSLPPLKILERPSDTTTCYPRPGMKAKRWCLPHEWRPF